MVNPDPLNALYSSLGNITDEKTQALLRQFADAIVQIAHAVQAVGSRPQPKVPSLRDIKIQLQAGGSAPLVLTGLAGRGYDTIQDEGTALAKENSLNFIGAAIQAVDNPGSLRTDVTVFDASATQDGAVTTGTQAFAGNKTFNGTTTFGDGTAGAKTIQFKNANTGILSWNPSGADTLTLPDATDTLVGKATTDVFTNKTLDTAGAGNVLKINGTGITAVNGTGAVLLTDSAIATTQFTIQSAGTPDLIIMVGATPSAEFFHDGTNGTVRADVGDLKIDAAAGKLVRTQKALTVKGATPTSAAGEIGFGNTQGLGTGALTNMQAPVIGAGTGPANAVQVVNWLELDIAGTKFWFPLFQ